MKRCYTLIEALIVLLITPLVMNLMVLLLQLMITSNTHDTKDLVHEVLRNQLRQLLLRSVNVECDEQTIFYDRDNDHFMILEDRDRLIKTPGYEILIEGVEDVYFSENEGIVIHYTYQDEAYEINTQVGTCPYL